MHCSICLAVDFTVNFNFETIVWHLSMFICVTNQLEVICMEKFTSTDQRSQVLTSDVAKSINISYVVEIGNVCIFVRGLVTRILMFSMRKSCSFVYVCFYTETLTFENKYSTRKKKGREKSKV